MPPVEAPQRKKRTAAAAAKPVPDGDHRKRRRNRTTQSCLNCHTSKRMCDRKRPACARCTQLGLTGLCVYEVDDPNQRADVDEQGRLRQRVAELEGVIREMKNKPHPRWASDSVPGTEPERWLTQRDDSFVHDVKPLASTSQSPILPFNAYPPSHAPDLVSSPSSSLSFFSSSSPLSTPSPIMTPADEYSHPPYIVDQQHSDVPSDLDLTSMFMPYQNYDPGYGDLHMEPHVHPSSTKEHHHPHHQSPHCGCLMESGVYNTMLDLSMRVRKASETLSVSQRHLHMGNNCNMAQRLSDFDLFASNALAGIPTPTNEVVSPNAPPFTPPDRQSIALASAIAQTTKMAAPDMSRSSHMPVSTISPQMLHAMRSQWESIPEPAQCDEGYIPWEQSRRL